MAGESAVSCHGRALCSDGDAGLEWSAHTSPALTVDLPEMRPAGNRGPGGTQPPAPALLHSLSRRPAQRSRRLPRILPAHSGRTCPCRPSLDPSLLHLKDGEALGMTAPGWQRTPTFVHATPASRTATQPEPTPGPAWAPLGGPQILESAQLCPSPPTWGLSTVGGCPWKQALQAQHLLQSCSPKVSGDHRDMAS